MRDMSKSRGSNFRANEAAAAGREKAIHIYSRNFKQAHEREAAAAYIDVLIVKYGPVVEGYPSWHPFVYESRSAASMKCAPETRPQGFEELDHTIYFRDAFVTAPYGNADRVVQSALNKKDGYISAEEITDVPLYNSGATPVLVTCEGIPKEDDGTITKRFALGSMLSTELPAWTWAECGESWTNMRRYVLGTPCGSRSSLFVNQETGKALREVYELLNRHELFGPIHL
jgi:hypothetical protein